jgi:hypothetical protein
MQTRNGKWVIYIGLTGALYVVGFGRVVVLSCLHAITWPVAFVIASGLELYAAGSAGISWLAGWSRENDAEMEEVAQLATE